MLSLTLGKPQSGISVTDYKAIRRELGKIEPALRRQLDKDIKQIITPAMNTVRAAIPATPPLSGMGNHSGRTAWRTGNPKAMKIYKPRNRPNGKLTVTLVGIRMMSAAASIADIAGRSGTRFGGSGRTNMYSWRGTLRSHPITAEGGAKFARNLTSRLGSGAFRISFPNVEKHLDLVEKQIAKVLDDAYKQLNGKLFN